MNKKIRLYIFVCFSLSWVESNLSSVQVYCEERATFAFFFVRLVLLKLYQVLMWSCMTIHGEIVTSVLYGEMPTKKRCYSFYNKIQIFFYELRLFLLVMRSLLHITNFTIIIITMYWCFLRKMQNCVKRAMVNYCDNWDLNVVKNSIFLLRKNVKFTINRVKISLWYRYACSDMSCCFAVLLINY